MLNESNLLAEDLVRFIDASPVSYNAVRNIITELESVGYTALSEGDKWELKPSNKYYIKRNDSGLIAFQLGENLPWESGYNIVGAHTDSPLLKVKNESLKFKSGCLSINVEAYGGGINSTWLDRDLSIAGKVSVLIDGVVVNKIVDFKRAVGIIPNLAIHLNREANKGFEYNKQNHLSVLLDSGSIEPNSELHFKNLIADEFGFDKDAILEMDLYFYDTQKGSIQGLNSDLISIGRLDNLAMCHSILQSLKFCKKSNSTKIGVFFDNEEIGSQTMQGADSNFLPSLLDRIVYSLGGSYEECQRARYFSFLISADGAHAEHPNFADKHDSSYSPKLNRGPVIKLSANYRYATTSESAAKFISLCKKVDVPFQKLANRSDVPSGSTIGPMSSSSLGIKTVDVGNPMLAMHSIRETQGVKDHLYMTKVIGELYNS